MPNANNKLSMIAIQGKENILEIIEGMVKR
jgi:hypothetical protein